MAKSDKELAVDVAIAYIHANQKQLIVGPNSISHESKDINVKVINEIISSVYGTLKTLEE